MVRRQNPLNPTHSGNARYMQCNLSKSYTCARGCINKCVYACVYIYIYGPIYMCIEQSVVVYSGRYRYVHTYVDKNEIDIDTDIHIRYR